jgi:fido (protein-threonine AMPylation protein)
MFQRFLVSTSENAKAINRAATRGEIRRIRRGLYTTDLETPLEVLVRQNTWEIIDLIAPGTVIGYRTAFELKPSPQGVLHLVGPKEKKLEIHGTKIWIHRGPGPLEGDMPYMETLYLASRPRAYLEVLQASRSGREFGNKGLPRAEIEERLDQRLRIRGEEDLNQLRDDARSLATLMDAHDERRELDGIVGSLLRTRDTPLASGTARARAAGYPYDPDRVPLFQEVHRVLLSEPIRDRHDKHRPGSEGFSNAAFFDSYFSNWIEGTEFLLEEAREIAFEGAIPAARPADGHDMLGTFSLVSDPDFMRNALPRLMSAPEGLEEVLHEAHRRIMAGRPEFTPGQFKTKPNRAGDTVFVMPELVRGTLHRAHKLLASLPDGLPRAAFLMFVISEVHPYTDGNGRVARAVMNAALVGVGQVRVIIPTVYRADYLTALKALSHQRMEGPFVHMMDRAQQFVSELPSEDYAETVRTLQATGAFDDSGDRRLRLPSELG